MKVIESGIYKITSPSGKVYIGQSKDILYRFRRYKQKTCRNQHRILASLNKYGSLSHKYEIIHRLPLDCHQSVYDNYEILYMGMYRECGFELLNIRGGGNGGLHSEETKLKIKANSRLGKKHTDEVKERLREIGKARGSFFIGKKHSKESKEKMSRAHKKNNKKPWIAGRVHSEETKRKMSESQKKRTDVHQFLGKHHTEESKLKMSLKLKGLPSARRKPVICTKTKYIYPSIQHAAESIGMQPNTLRMQMRGCNRNKTTFKYLNDASPTP